MPKASNKFAVVTLIPAVHKGYIDFFRKFPGTIYVISKDFISDFVHIERDLRTPDFEDLKKILLSVEGIKNVVELTRENIKDIPDDLQIVMPDDEITRGIAEKYFKNRKIVFESIFLRWTRQISTTELEVHPDRVVSHNEVDRELIKQANKLAESSADWWRQIGALLVKDGKVLITGFNKNTPSNYSIDAFGDPRSNFNAGERFDLVNTTHAEANTIAIAAKKGIEVSDSSLYVTTFPCPVCARLISAAGIKKVYYSKGYSLLDAESVLKAYGIEIILVK